MPDNAYDESQIVSLVTEYYNLVLSLCYLSADEVDFPPPEGRQIDEELCNSLGLTPEVMSLMRRLPCPSAEGTMAEYEMFIPNSFANSFVNSKLIDLAEIQNTLRVVTFDPPSAPEDEDEPNAQYDYDPASEYDHYTRFPVHNPTQFLRSCIDRVRSLEWLPRHVHGPGVISTHHEGPEYTNLKEILKEEYGWPENFRHEAWRQDYKRIFKENS